MEDTKKMATLAQKFELLLSEMGTIYDVTVGIPVYNIETLIHKGLLSVLEQTFEGNMEVLVINDGCTDNTMEIVRELQASHPRGGQIRIYDNAQNMGVGMTRNIIIDKAQGKYLIFVDSDDYITPDCVQKLYSEAEKHQAEVVYGSVKTINSDVELSYLSQPYRVFDSKDELASYAFQNLHENLRNYIWNTLFLVSFLKEQRLKFPGTRFHEDVIFSSDMVPLVKKAVLIPDITYYYVMRAHSLSNLQGRTSINQEEIKKFIEIYTYVKNKNKVLRGKPYYEARCARSMTQMLYIVSGLLKNKRIISPPLTNRMIKDAMRHPASFSEIMRFKKYRVANLAFFMLGIMPSWLTVCVISLIAKYKRI